MKYSSNHSAAFMLLVISLSACSRPGGPEHEMVRLSESVRQTVEEKMALLETPVTLDLYAGGPGERRAAETRALMDLMAQSTNHVTVREHSLDAKPAAVKALDVEHGPVIVVDGTDPAGIAYYGYPSHLDLEPFLDSVLMASGSAPPLNDDTEVFLDGLGHDVLIRIFVSPTCSKCPEIFRLAANMAARSARVSLKVFVVQEFPDEGREFQVMQIPKTWINDRTWFEGIPIDRRQTEKYLVIAIRQALDQRIPPGRLILPAIE